MGWLISRGVGRLASYFPAIRFRASLFQPEVMRRVLRAGSVQRAIQLAAKERNRPVGEATNVTQVLPPEVKITSPDAGALQEGKVEVKAVARQTGDHPVKT